MCIEAFPDSNLVIGCTQPRRIAATSVAGRVAEELQAGPATVGYKIRFHDHTSKETKIKFMTDGVLLAETRSDRLLSQYGVIIIDEAHERSLNIDFLLGYLKKLLKYRRDLKVVISSATIDTSAFAKHFDDAPVISVSGRTYPVTVKYRPPEDGDNDESESLVEHCVAVVKELFDQRVEGDLLIFLATEREIRQCCKLLQSHFPHCVVLPLFGRLPSGDQRKIFQPQKKIKIIVATNVAETSLTVPGIRYVIDSGLARISYYNVRAKTTSLPVTKISQASCDQRKGRCGRVGPGVCIRLYSEEDYLDRQQFTLPELKRSNLAEVILQMISLKLGDPADFPFLEPPFNTAIREGYRLLKELGAITGSRKLTGYGKIMADLPIDPCISRVILEARQNNCLREIKIIASVLAIADPRVRPADSEQDADNAHKTFAHPHSDFMSFLNLWNLYHDQAGSHKSWSKLKKFCKASFLSFQRMREWFDLHDQLTRMLSKRQGFSDNSGDGDYLQIHKALITGFARNLAMKKNGRIYQGSQNKELMIFPGSGQFAKSPGWILGASFLETNNLYALTVASIDPDWIKQCVPHLCKYSWSNPRWQKKTGQVVADETASLFGLVISSGTKVDFVKRHRKNSKSAREIFIQALIEGELKGSYSFLTHNLSLIKKWQNSEDRMRVRNLVADDLILSEFYDSRLPDSVCDQRSLNKFLKQHSDPELLVMKDRDILIRQIDDRELVDFPTRTTIGSTEIRLEYQFAPGTERDGVTFRIPLQMAKTMSPERFDWLVPGFIDEKVTYLFKSLPKSLRKKLVPVNESVARVLDDIEFGKGSLLTALEQSILKQFRFLVARDQWTRELPPHLTPIFLLFDEHGDEICSGRNLAELIHQNSRAMEPDPSLVLRGNAEKIVGKWQHTEYVTWDFAGLPSRVPIFTKTGETAGYLYGALQADQQKQTIQVVFENDPEKASRINREGTLFLLRIPFKDQYKALKKLCSTSFSGPSTLIFAKLGLDRNELVRLVLDFIVASLFAPLDEGIIEESAYLCKIEHLRKTGFFKEGRNILEQILASLRQRREVESQLTALFEKSRSKKHFLPPLEQEFMAEIDMILPHDFLLSDFALDFNQVERQLRGISLRAQRFYANPDKDAKKKRQLEPHLSRLIEGQKKKKLLSADALREFVLYQSMFNEFKLQLFAPELTGKNSISSKKLDHQWKTFCSTS